MTQHNRHFAITDKNLKATFEHARKLINAKDINEVMQLQTEFLRNQFGIATEQSKQMGGGIASPGGRCERRVWLDLTIRAAARFMATVIEAIALAYNARLGSNSDLLAFAGQVCFAPDVLQKSKVASVRIFGETLKREAIDDSYHRSRATEVAYEFSVRRWGPSELYTKPAPAALKIFWHLPQKDFCNTIRPWTDIAKHGCHLRFVLIVLQSRKSNDAKNLAKADF
jgi:hypothetical protein